MMATMRGESKHDDWTNNGINNNGDDVVVGSIVTTTPKTILQKTSKYNDFTLNTTTDRTKVAVVSPERRKGKTQSAHDVESIPGVYVDTIIKGFGPNADLYEDVLGVSRDQSDRDIRIAYFRRGREVLAEGGVRGLDEAASMGHVSNIATTRFQAVSMAYEILSHQPWKEFYSKHGLVYATGTLDDCLSVDTDSPASGSMISAPQKSSVRWNENVEELLYEREPEEASNAKFTSVKDIRKRKKRSNRIRVMVDAQHLDAHLAQLDEEAEKHFLPDFWDSLEESLDGLLKLATSGNEEKTEDAESISRARPERVERSDVSVSSVDSDATPFDETYEDAITQIAEKQKFKGNNDFPSSYQHSPSRRQKNGPTSPFRPISPDVSDKGATDDTKSVKSYESDLFDLESIASGLSEVKNYTAQKAKEFLDGVPPPSDQSKINEEDEDDDDDGDVFEGLEDENSETNDEFEDIELSREEESDDDSSEDAEEGIDAMPESEKASKHNSRSDFVDRSRAATSVDSKQNDDSMEGDFDALCGTSPFMYCASACLPSSEALPPSNTESGEEGKSDEHDEDGFMEYFMAYITAIVNECAVVGSKLAEVDWDDTIMGAFVVEDRQVGGVLDTIDREIESVQSIDATDAVRPLDSHFLH